MEKKTSGLAVTALVMGIIAFVASFVPFLNIVSFIFVILAVVFGIVGLVVTVRGTKTGKGLAIAGLVLGILALVITIAMYGGAAASLGSSDGAGSSAGGAAQTEQDAQADQAAQADGADQAADYAVTIDGCRLAEDYEGAPVAVVTYTFTNNSDDATSFAVALHAQAFQNGVQLNTAIGSDWDSEKYMSEIKPGASTTVELGYELEDESDVTVEVTELISFDDTILASETFTWGEEA